MNLVFKHDFKEKNFGDINYLTEVIRFIIVNLILLFILLFLFLEAIDWAIFSYRTKTNENLIDSTSWNLSKLFMIY